MIQRLPLGRKIMLLSVLVVGGALLIVGAATTFFLHREEMDAMDGRLRDDARHYLEEFRKRDSRLEWINPREVEELLRPGDNPRRFLEITGPDGASLYRSKNLGSYRLAGLRPGAHTREIGEHGSRVVVVSEGGVTVHLATDLDVIEELVYDIALSYFIALPVVLAAVALGGWWIARQALAPVRGITAAAEKITATRLDQRLPVPPVCDEISRLAMVLNETFDRLDASFRQAMRFSADASHELKTPLTILRSGIEDLLRSGEVSPAGERAVAALLEQTRGLSAITESLLLLARADAGKLQLDLRPADVSEVVASCVEDARIMAEERGISIETELPTEAFAPVDRGRLTQILLNLFENAVKYNRDGGSIRVVLRAASAALTVTIGNTGPGIPPEHASRIFERFHRAEHAATISGHGLGLSLARELARAHGGDLTLTRADAEWTDFQLTLGVAPALAYPNPPCLVGGADDNPVI